MRIMLVEDHALLAHSLAVTLRMDGFVVDLPASVEPADVRTCAENARPDLVFLDLCLGFGVTALPLIEILCGLGCRVAMLTAETDEVRLAECVAAGAIGVVPKSASFDELVAAIRHAASGASLLTAARRHEMLEALAAQRAEHSERLASFHALTPREQFVLGQLMEGRSAEQIASDSVVSLTTVRTQVRSILAKLGVRSQISAVASAYAAGWSPSARQLTASRSS